MPATKTNAKPRVQRKKNAGADTVPAILVLRQFRVVFNAVKTHFRSVETEAGVGGAQLWALSVIKSHPDIGMNDLAQAMDIHQSTASNLVKSLIARDMITTKKAGTDRRAVALRVSANGKKVLRSAPKPFSGVLPDALASLDTRTLARLEKDLNKLILALDTDEDAAKMPLADL